MDTLSLLRSGKLTGSRRLDLSCGLQQFPAEIYDLADSLEILNLSGNSLSKLPSDLTRLKRLRVIFCSDNHFTHVPEVLGELPQLEMVGFKTNRITHLPAASLPGKLRWLILTDNRLDELPESIGNCLRLQKCMLAGNRLQHLPDEMAACRQLQLLRISANRFASLPPWLLSLPKLAWLAFAGNPLANIGEKASLANHDVTDIHWDHLDLQHALGEGASGIIHRASLRREPGEGIPVAVKLFKGSVTSDGLPASEKAACLAAGSHPGLIGVAGKVCGHPQGQKALVLPLIDPSFINLADPPSLESCTHDVYPEDVKFSLPIVLSIAQKIAAAAGHLHAKGIMHGDLYAHNILWRPDGACLLGDFGAASFYPTDDAQLAASLQKIEVRAFACLLEELLDRCIATPQSQDTLAKLGDLQQNCNQAETAARPSFVEIIRLLTPLQQIEAIGQQPAQSVGTF